MKNNFFIGLGILIIISLLHVNLQAQECKTTDDLLLDEGTLGDRKKTPYQGFVSDFTPAEKTVALKTLNTLETFAVKDFSIRGGTAQAWFNFNELYFFDTWLHKSYEYKMGFYPFACVNGKKINSNEYISDFKITANPSIPCFFSLPPEFESSNSFFDADRSKNNGPKIAIYRYLVFTNPDFAAAVNTGNGYYENDNNDVYNNHRDINREWYIIRKGTKLLSEVSRKEYLNSLLEYYEREKMLLTKRSETKIADAKKYMAQYEKNGNKAMFQSHLENKQTAEQKLTEMQRQYEAKKEKVTALLNTKSQDWLNQVAKINPDIRKNGNCTTGSDFENTGYFTFSGFDETSKAAVVYKWNPEYFKIELQSPAEPLFFKVAFRYKANTPFTLNIKENYIKNLNFDYLRKLLVIK